MNWLRNFMYGRYGSDQLSMALLILSIVITFVGGATGLPFLRLLGYVPLGYAIFRMLSKNTSKRSMENYKFSMLISPVYSWFRRTKDRLGDKTHKYYKCPNCKAVLRVPKGKGKIIITCRKCNTKFTKKT